ncbi:MAG: hypothetical protein KGH78_04790 [Candidatus Micrarchaeota archaeon]|nr:hypothetical protein [Candidatus Micrarchaeota archaeon]MDE1847220.1 hypothetical protein [Candidatus Micrarchaeota archaeon]
MAKHCPICNRSSEEAHFYGEICEFCTIERLGNTLPSEAKITICKRCGRVNYNGEFVEQDRKVLESILQRQFKEFDLQLISYIEAAAIVELNKYEDNIEGIRKEIALRYLKVMCPQCNRKSAGYYEAVVQLRGSKERVAKMYARIEKYFLANEQFIARVERANNGVDMYLSSKKLTSAFMAERGLKPTMSYELHGMKNGRRLYRNTYALHLD